MPNNERALPGTHEGRQTLRIGPVGAAFERIDPDGQVRAEIGPKTPDDKQYFQGSGEKPGITDAPDAVLHPVAGGTERPKELQTADGQCGNNVTIQPHGPGAATRFDPAAEGIGVTTLPK